VIVPETHLQNSGKVGVLHRVSRVGPDSPCGLDSKDCINRVQKFEQSLDVFVCPGMYDIDVVRLHGRSLQHRCQTAYEDELDTALLKCGQTRGEATLLHSTHESAKHLRCDLPERATAQRA
jgi:hypothetical protein